MIGQGELLLTFFRAYNPELGRWLSTDPIREMGGLNLYEYAQGNPIMLMDPLGLEVIIIDDMSKKIIAWLKLADPDLKKMIEDLESSGHKHYVKCDTDPKNPLWKAITQSIVGNTEEEKNETNGVGTDTYVNGAKVINTYSNGQRLTPTDVLAHELQHAWDLDKGLINRAPNPKTGNWCSEERAVRTQNIARKALKLDLLETYGDPGKGGKKVEDFDKPLTRF